MRTTVEIPDELLKRAKRLALEQNSTLRELITRGLEAELTKSGAEQGVRIAFPLLHVGSDCPLLRLSPDQIKDIEAEQEAQRHRDLLAGR